MAPLPTPPLCCSDMGGLLTPLRFGCWEGTAWSVPPPPLGSPTVCVWGGAVWLSPPSLCALGGGIVALPLFVPAAPDYDKSQWINEKEKLGLDFPNVWGGSGGGGTSTVPLCLRVPHLSAPPNVPRCPPQPPHVPLPRCPIPPPPKPQCPPTLMSPCLTAPPTPPILLHCCAPPMPRCPPHIVLSPPFPDAPPQTPNPFALPCPPRALVPLPHPFVPPMP